MTPPAPFQPPAPGQHSDPDALDPIGLIAQDLRDFDDDFRDDVIDDTLPKLVIPAQPVPASDLAPGSLMAIPLDAKIINFESMATCFATHAFVRPFSKFLTYRDPDTSQVIQCVAWKTQKGTFIGAPLAEIRVTDDPNLTKGVVAEAFSTPPLPVAQKTRFARAHIFIDGNAFYFNVVKKNRESRTIHGDRSDLFYDVLKHVEVNLSKFCRPFAKTTTGSEFIQSVNYFTPVFVDKFVDYDFLTSLKNQGVTISVKPIRSRNGMDDRADTNMNPYIIQALEAFHSQFTYDPTVTDVVALIGGTRDFESILRAIRESGAKTALFLPLSATSKPLLDVVDFHCPRIHNKIFDKEATDT